MWPIVIAKNRESILRLAQNHQNLGLASPEVLVCYMFIARMRILLSTCRGRCQIFSFPLHLFTAYIAKESLNSFYITLLAYNRSSSNVLAKQSSSRDCKYFLWILKLRLICFNYQGCKYHNPHICCSQNGLGSRLPWFALLFQVFSSPDWWAKPPCECSKEHMKYNYCLISSLLICFFKLSLTKIKMHHCPQGGKLTDRPSELCQPQR